MIKKIKQKTAYLNIRSQILNYLKVYKERNDFIREYSELGIQYKEVLRLKNLPFKADTETFLFGKSIKITSPYWYLFGLNEIFFENQYLFKTNNPSPLIIDCGSNIGLSIIFFKRQYPNSKIIAFEADPNLYKILEENISKYKFNDIELLNNAIWINNDLISFDSDNTVGGKIDINISEISSNKIQAFRLKKLLNQKIDFLKIDIEGVECEVLRDCKDVLVNVQNIFIEYHSVNNNESQSLSEILKILESSGFRYYIKEAWQTKKVPFIDKMVASYFDLQLNIFAFKL